MTCIRTFKLSVLGIFIGMTIVVAQSTSCIVQPCGVATDSLLVVARNLSSNEFDWESCDCQHWYGFSFDYNANNPNNEVVYAMGNAFTSAKDLLNRIRISGDYTRARGWRLLKRDFGSDSNIKYPHFILFNSDAKLIRLFLYISSLHQLGQQKVAFNLTHNGLVREQNYIRKVDGVMNVYEQIDETITIMRGDTETVINSYPGSFSWTVATFKLPTDTNGIKPLYTSENIGVDIENVSYAYIESHEEISPSLNTQDTLLSIYPNPAYEDVVYFTKTLDQYQLKNMLGIVVKEGKNVSYMDLKGLPRTTYYLITSDKEIKLVIL